jgi:predicted RNA-binding protein
MAVCVSILTAATAWTAMADQPAETTTTKSEKSYSGTVANVDSKEHVLSVKGWAFSKKSFNLSENCVYATLEKNPADIGDIRAGQKVSVNYKDVHGVLIANRVTQEAMEIEGMVKGIDAGNHTLELHRPGTDKFLQIADDCKIVLRDGKVGSFADIKVGNHVNVTYETPDDKMVAHQIAQTSIAFMGSLTAIDLDDRTIKAKSAFATKKFNLADNCAIVINGRMDGQLADLKPNDRLMFSYDEIEGVNVANRIERVETKNAPASAAK